jgi:MFS family permease
MNILKKRWGYLLMAVILLLFMGIGYAFSIFVLPIEHDLGLTRADTSFVFTLCFICFALGSLTTGFILPKFSPTLLLRVAACMFAVGFVLSTRAVALWQLYFTYSICAGFSIGIAYNITVSLLPMYFPDRSGIATGILLMGFSMSTTLLGPICETGLSRWGWKTVFLVLGVCGAMVLLVSSMLLHKPTDAEQKYLAHDSVSKNHAVDLAPAEILRTRIYFVFLAIYISIGGVGMSLINHGAMTLQEDLAVNASTAAVLVGIVCLFNGIGRVIWGIAYDRIGSISCLRCLGVFVAVSMAMVTFSLISHNAQLFIAGMGVALFCYGGSSSLAPILVRALFGNKYFSMNFAITNIGTILLSCVPAVIGTMQTICGNYLIPYMAVSGLAVIALLMTWIYKPVLHKSGITV